MTETTGLDPTLRNRILRYIHTGTEFPKYFPGCWRTHKYFEQNNLTAVKEALEIDPNNTEVVKLILKAGKDGWYTRFEAVIFALVKCLKHGSQTVKEASYNAATEICVTTEQMLLFNKYTWLLDTGNGHGWCRSVREWYTNKEPMALAKELTRVRGRYGRTHNTILRKAHYKVPEGDVAREAVIKYAIFGFKHAKQLMDGKPEAKPIFDYIQIVENMRLCEDPVAAGEIAARYKFSLDHVPGHLLTSQDVWNAVMPQLTLSDLLYNIQRIHNMGFLNQDSPTTAIMVSLLTNKDYIKKSKVTPLEVYITLCNYKKKSRPLRHDKAKVLADKEQRRRTRQVFDSKTGLWQWTSAKRHPKEIKNWGVDLPPNQAVLSALNKLMESTWLNTPPTKARYLITLDMRHHMFKGRHFCKKYSLPKKGKKVTITTTNGPGGGGDANNEIAVKKHLLAECFYNNNVTPGHAAIIMALQLLKREKSVKIAVFTEEGIEEVSLEKNFGNIDEAEFLLRKSNLGRVQFDAPITWATNNKQKFDVFINIVDRPTRFMELDQIARGGRGPGGRFGPPPDTDIVDHCPVRALERYRKAKTGVKDAKLVVMSLASHRVGTTDGRHEGVLDIVGIDEHVPKVLDAFVLGQFK